MRILYLSGGFPYPLTSGYMRHYYFIRGLSKQHQITLLSLASPSFRQEHADALAPYTEKVVTFISEGRGRSMLGKTQHAIRTAITKDKSELKMRAAVEELLATEQFDVVLFSGRDNYAVIEGLELPPIVVDFTDANLVRLRLQMQVAPKYQAPGLWYKYLKMKQIETKLLERAAHGLFAAARDRDALAPGREDEMTVVPNGVDFNTWKRESAALGENTLIFTGAMNYAPNVDAAVFLVEQVLPIVRRTYPEIKALIVGHSPKPSVVALGQAPGVTVTGFVDDVRPYLEQASLFVAPLRFGAGIQNKVLEAMSMQVPVVASTLAAEGLVTEDGDQPPLTIADTPDELAAAICDHLQRQASDRRPPVEGRRYVEQHFNWDVCVDKVDRVLRRVAVPAAV